MNQLNIRLATDNDQPKWDAYVASHPDAGPYHLYAWKTAVEKSYGHKGLYLMAEDTDSGFVVGVLPLILFRLPMGAQVPGIASLLRPWRSQKTWRMKQPKR
jgi:hypothetical protein